MHHNDNNPQGDLLHYMMLLSTTWHVGSPDIHENGLKAIKHQLDGSWKIHMVKHVCIVNEYIQLTAQIYLLYGVFPSGLEKPEAVRMLRSPIEQLGPPQAKDTILICEKCWKAVSLFHWQG